MRITPRCATAVAVLALLVAGCEGEAGVPRDALDHLARAVVRGEDHVQPRELAAWLIDGNHELEVIDLRDAADYDAGHIDSAQQVDLTRLVGEQELGRLAGVERVVVYAEAAERAAQAAVLLRIAGVAAYSLDGGYRAWQEMLSGTQKTAEPLSAEAARERTAVSCFFSGDYQRAQGFSRDAGGYMPPLAPVAPAADTGAPPVVIELAVPETAPAGEVGLIVEEGC